MQQATLPTGRANVDRSIASMDVGDAGWTVPWAMYHDDSRRLWLNGNYTIEPRSGGTVQMRVWRDDAGWHVDASSCRDDETWGTDGFIGRFPPIAVASFRQ